MGTIAAFIAAFYVGMTYVVGLSLFKIEKHHSSKQKFFNGAMMLGAPVTIPCYVVLTSVLAISGK